MVHASGRLQRLIYLKQTRRQIDIARTAMITSICAAGTASRIAERRILEAKKVVVARSGTLPR
jgi:hypothetical protein